MLSVRVGAKTLFATHYHELTELGAELSTVENAHVAADERDGDVTFRRTVREGPADRSYGVHVADLAGVPEPVVERSRDVLDRLRNDEAIDIRGTTPAARHRPSSTFPQGSSSAMGHVAIP